MSEKKVEINPLLNIQRSDEIKVVTDYVQGSLLSNSVVNKCSIDSVVKSLYIVIINLMHQSGHTIENFDKMSEVARGIFKEHTEKQDNKKEK